MLAQVFFSITYISTCKTHIHVYIHILIVSKKVLMYRVLYITSHAWTFVAFSTDITHEISRAFWARRYGNNPGRTAGRCGRIWRQDFSLLRSVADNARRWRSGELRRENIFFLHNSCYIWERKSYRVGRKWISYRFGVVLFGLTLKVSPEAPFATNMV